MARKLFIFLTGMVTLSIAWVSITSSVRSFQETAQKESNPVKFNLLQSKWSRLTGFDALVEGEIKKPADFVFKFEGASMDLVDTKVNGDTRIDLYVDAKKAYLDSGKGIKFYVLDIPSERESYLVRVDRSEAGLSLVGFPTDMVLNYLSNGLGGSEWFLVDSKKRVLGSDERAYVGKTHRINKLYNRFSFKIGKERFTLALLKPKVINLAMANTMGILGIGLVLAALFLYTNEEGLIFKPAEAVVAETDYEFGEDLDMSHVEEPEEDDIQMVDLTSEKPPLKEHASQGGLGYSDFLMDNPVLAEAPEVEESVEVAGDLGEKLTEEILEEPTVTGPEDWVKLAEDLSASIDKFTQSLETEKKPAQEKAEV